MVKLSLVSLVKRFRDQVAVGGVSVDVPEGCVAVLLGPSGCGKTTTLRLVAGLLHPDAGAIWLDGREVAGAGWGVPPERRNLAMVFQNYALWPHKTVFDNVAYGLRVRRLSRDEVRRRVERALALVHMPSLARRFPAELSGGQQQRVALARAIVVEPAILLLDEPLSNLDAVLRAEMRGELRTLQRELGLTCVYVTHDQAEAMVLADHLVVMRGGAVEQQGAPEELYRHPRSRFVASFLGATNLVPGRLVRLDDGPGCLEAPETGPLWAHVPEGVREHLAPGAAAWLSVRPGDVTLAAHPAPTDRGTHGSNRIQGRVVHRAFLGELAEYTVEAGGAPWKVRAHPSSPFAPGQAVWLCFPPAAATIVVDA
ncbi:MAG: ABC transporter ATP-binding protein [Candidatus Rokubacteria bacterium]|nr:ABC transporter ATP-binding protein [Candidatus Rokubacteria bacterium]